MRHTSTIVRTALAVLLGGLLAVPAAAQAATRPAATGQTRRQVIDLGTLGDGYTISEARAVNDRGQVVGDSMLAGLGPEHAFLWEHGRMRDLGTLGGGFSSAAGINAPGAVVGQAGTTEGPLRAFVWRHGVMTDLGVLADGGENGSRANDINNHGWVVGASDAAGGEYHAVLWR